MTTPPSPPPDQVEDLADLADEIAALHQARLAADERAEALAARLAVIESLAPAPAGANYTYRYEYVEDWVDEVFARVAVGHRAKWCTNWAAHPEALIRLQVLWHTWETAFAHNLDDDPNWLAADEWLRCHLDHHAPALLDVDGPFAGCIPARGTEPGRCSPPPRLAQRPLMLTPPATVTRLEAHRLHHHPEALAQ